MAVHDSMLTRIYNIEQTITTLRGQDLGPSKYVVDFHGSPRFENKGGTLESKGITEVNLKKAGCKEGLRITKVRKVKVKEGKVLKTKVYFKEKVKEEFCESTYPCPQVVRYRNFC